MTYKIVRDTQGEVVCFGPNDAMYEPVVKAGEVLTIEATLDATKPMVARLVKEAADQVAIRVGAHRKLAALGFTTAEIDTLRN